MPSRQGAQWCATKSPCSQETLGTTYDTKRTLRDESRRGENRCRPLAETAMLASWMICTIRQSSQNERRESR